MRWFLLLVVLLVLAIPIGAVLVAVFGTAGAPLIEGDAVLSAANVARARDLLREHDPRGLRSGETRTVSMNEEELTLVLNDIADRLGGGGAALSLNDGALSLLATLDLSRFVPGRYLNIDASLASVAGKPRIESLRLGAIPVPPGLANTAASMAAERLYRASGVRDAGEVIKAVEIGPQRLDVTYEWNAGIVDAVRERLVSQDDRVRIRAYHDYLAATLAHDDTPVTFTALVASLFAKAGERSVDGDADAENRAAILVLDGYVSGRGMRALVPESTGWPALPRRRLRLRGRADFVQHFSTSAALAVTGGDAVANAIGLTKEIDDSDGGSGFSFRDLAADMAGTRFGNTAVADDASARRLQERLAARIDDATLMPAVDGLEERLTDAAFRASYGGVGGERYEAAVADIERRIDALPLYR